jgi:multidrug resistance efflux pump
VHNGDLIIELQDDDLRAQVDQASAAVAAARAAIENNRRQGELQDLRIAQALVGIDESTAQVVAAEAGKEAVQAQLVPAHSERKRQQALKQTRSTTQQTPEAAVANNDPLSAQLASRDADLNQAQTMLRSSE